jgi:hypothetical protein
MSIKFYGLDRGANQQPEAINVGTYNGVPATTTADTNAATADNDVGTVVTNNTATLAAIDAFGAAVIAITGDTYTAHQFGGAASTGLTAAQCNTLFKTGGSSLNTAITDFLTGQTNTNTAKTATAATKTATAAAIIAATPPNDMTLLVDLAAASTCEDVILVLEAFRRRLESNYGNKDLGSI